MQLLLKKGRLVDPAAGRDEEIDLLIRDGVIERMGANLAVHDAQSYDLKGSDRFRFPSTCTSTFVAGFRIQGNDSYGRRCSRGRRGFTAVCCMPTPSGNRRRVRGPVHPSKAEERPSTVLVDVYPVQAVTKGRRGEQLAPLAELSDAGAVAFRTTAPPCMMREIMRRHGIRSNVRKPVIQHAQEMSKQGGVMTKGLWSTALGLPGMPSLAEDIMVSRGNIQICRYHPADISRPPPQPPPGPLIS